MPVHTDTRLLTGSNYQLTSTCIKDVGKFQHLG